MIARDIRDKYGIAGRNAAEIAPLELRPNAPWQLTAPSISPVQILDCVAATLRSVFLQ